MRVRYKKLNQIVEIPDDRFDPSLYEQVQESASTPSQALKSEPIQSKPTKNTSLGENLLNVGKGALNFLAPQTVKQYQQVGDIFTNQDKYRKNPELANQAVQDVQNRQGKSALELLSFLTPYGKGANIATKAIIPGLMQGGLLGLSKDEASAESVGQSALTGGLVGGAFGLPGAIARTGGKAIQKMLGITPEVIAEKGAANFLKGTPSQYAKVIEQHGVNPNELVKKYVPKGVGYDEMLGATGERAKGGIIGTKLSQAEGKIQQTIKAAGSNQKISGQPIITALKEELKSLKGRLGDETKEKALEKIIAQAEQKYKDGSTLKKATDTLRSANSRFGASILETEAGAVATSAQKVEANALRRVLKDLYPELKDALDTQSDLLTLRPMINTARAKLLSSGTKAGGIDFTRPGTLIEPVLQRPEVASSIAQGGRMPTGQGSPLRGIPSKLGIPALDSIFGRQQQLPQQDQIEQMINTPQQGEPTQQQLPPQQGKLDPNVLLQMMQLDIAETGGKNVSELKTLYDVTETQRKASQGSGTGGKVSGKDRENAAAGLESLALYEQKLKEDPNILIKASLPGSIGARDFVALGKEVADVYTRLRTGAALNEQEIAFYNSQLPGLLDMTQPETIPVKIGLFKRLFQRFSQAEPVGDMSLSYPQ